MSDNSKKPVPAEKEVMPTQGNRPVSSATVDIHSIKGHRVLTPVISQSELAEELFQR